MDVATLSQRAEEGDALAQNLLGYRYAVGWQVSKDPAIAMAWYKKAAAQGHAGAAGNLASMYINGEGVPSDPAEGQKWARASAAKGHRSGFFFLAYMNALGVGMPKNSPEAERCYLYAARQGHGQAQSNLSYMYKVGDGIPADPIMATVWLLRGRGTQTSGPIWTASPWRVLPARLGPNEKGFNRDVLYCQDKARLQVLVQEWLTGGQTDEAAVARLVEQKMPADEAQALVKSLRLAVAAHKATTEVEMRAYSACIREEMPGIAPDRVENCSEHLMVSRLAFLARKNPEARKVIAENGNGAMGPKLKELQARAFKTGLDQEFFMHVESLWCLGLISTPEYGQ